MAPLREQFESTGNWLFRWRSFVPLLFLIPLLVEMWHFDWPMHSHRLQQEWELCCIVVSFFGLTIRGLTVGCVPFRTSGRNTKGQRANSLNVTGMYSMVRHPLYVGNFFMWLGFAMFFLEWRFLLIFVLGFGLYYERIMFAEEEFLRQTFPLEFPAWAASTPAIFPRFSRWQAPVLPFCLKTVLRREYSGLLGVAVMFFMLDFVGDWIVRKRPVVEMQHVFFLGICLATYLVLRTLKKRTRLLHVAGR